MIGRTISHYHVIEKIASGGMGVVYKAEDTRLGRLVALKFLPDEMAMNSSALDRFRREARAASTLNHPGICTIYDIDEVDGQFFIVMELLEGQTLKNHINGKPLRIEEVLDTGIAVVEAMGKAHAKGIIHRDINPANIFLTKDGQTKILDFGLAKVAMDPCELKKTGNASLSSLTTQIDQLTMQGMTMGTMAYMSPEQARGEAELDARTDLFSMGAVLYEMATGRHPFSSPNTLLTFDAILHGTPTAPIQLNPDMPAKLEHIINRALEKDRSLRYQAAAELLSDLKGLKREIDSGHSGEIIPTTTAPFRKMRIVQFVTAGIAILAITVAASVLFFLWNHADGIHIARSTQLTVAQVPELDPAISPDGKFLAYTAPVGANMHIFVRQVAGGSTVDITEEMPGTHRTPQWSPDGTQILFVTNLPDGTDMVSVVPNLGGIPQRMVEINVTRFMPCVWGPAWAPGGERIAYALGNAIYTLSLDGGELVKIADAFEAHSLSWSPDGEWIAFVSGNYGFIALGNIAPSSLQIVRASGGVPIRITDDDPFLNVSPDWLPDSRSLLFVSNRDGSRDLYLARITNSGSLREEVSRLTTGLNAQTISISNDGKRLIYSVFSMKTNLWALPIPSKGPVSPSEAHPITSGNQVIEGIDISPDGQWIVFDSNRSGNQDIYRMQRSGGRPEPLTKHPADDFLANFSSDGKWLAFHSFRNGNRDLYSMSNDGNFISRITFDSAQERYPHWSPDGKSLAFYSDKTGQQEIFIVSKDDAGIWGEPRQLTQTGGIHPEWSPDGKWIAYFQDGDVRLISPEGGQSVILVAHQPSMNSLFGAFSRDGKVLFYKGNDRNYLSTIWSVPVSGGTPMLLVQFDDPLRPSLRPEFAVDTRDILYTVTERESDIWILELRGVPLSGR